MNFKKAPQFLTAFSLVLMLGMMFLAPQLVMVANAQDNPYGDNLNSSGNNTAGTLSLACPDTIRTFKELVNCTVDILSSLIPLIIGAGVVYVIYAGFQFVRADGDGREEWREKLVYGIVGIFVMVSVWGLVNILYNTFSLDNSPISRPVIAP